MSVVSVIFSLDRYNLFACKFYLCVTTDILNSLKYSLCVQGQQLVKLDKMVLSTQDKAQLQIKATITAITLQICGVDFNNLSQQLSRKH